MEGTQNGTQCGTQWTCIAKSVDGGPAQRKLMRIDPTERRAVGIGGDQSLLKCMSWQPMSLDTLTIPSRLVQPSPIAVHVFPLYFPLSRTAAPGGSAGSNQPPRSRSATSRGRGQGDQLNSHARVIPASGGPVRARANRQCDLLLVTGTLLTTWPPLL
jgi:hypothetical protein